MSMDVIIADKYQLPAPRGELISRGAVGWVYKINNRIALKYPRKGSCEAFAYEVKIYDILESHRPLCSDICRSFLRIPEGNFLAFCSGGTLDQRLQENQIRNEEPHGGRLIEVKQKEPLYLVERWIMQLSNAAAWLESLGYSHTDIRPANLLLDHQDHLKLTDFDCMDKIGSPALGSAPPWARVLGSEAGSERGSFGDNGARVEQFAIGSVLYLMTRGYEPYDDGTFDPDDTIVVDLLQQMKFPSLGDEILDEIIERCWKGEYPLLKDLADDTKLLSGASTSPRAAPLTDEYCKEVREECQRLIDAGLLDGISEGSCLL